MKRINKKGFTLIELLAVIVILGILMLIAIPSVTKYIDKSKKEAYINNAHSYIEAVRKDIIAGYLQTPNANQELIVKLESITLEKGSNKSPYGDYDDDQSYIMVKNRNNQLEYYIAARDDKDYEIPLTNEKNLTTNSVSKNEVSKISPTTDYGVKSEENTKIVTNLFNGTLHDGYIKSTDTDTNNFTNAQYTDEFVAETDHTYKVVGVQSYDEDNGDVRWRISLLNGTYKGEIWKLEREFTDERKVYLILINEDRKANEKKISVPDLNLFGIYDITDTMNK